MIICDKCHNGMIAQQYKGVKYFGCIFCGNVIYPGMPKRVGDMGECRNCGELYKGLDGGICKNCLPKDQKLCICGILFTPSRGQKKYHSKECANNERNKRRRKGKMSEAQK